MMAGQLGGAANLGQNLAPEVAMGQSLACQSLAAGSAAASQPMTDVASMQMHLPEEELAAVLKQPALMSGVTGLDTINKMFQRQARRLELQLVQQVQNKHAIELALETLQADLQVQKQQSTQQGKRLARVHEATREMEGQVASMASERSEAVQNCKRVKTEVDGLSAALAQENPEALRRCQTASLSDIAANGTDLASHPALGHLFRESNGKQRAERHSGDGGSSEASSAEGGTASAISAASTAVNLGRASTSSLADLSSCYALHGGGSSGSMQGSGSGSGSADADFSESPPSSPPSDAPAESIAETPVAMAMALAAGGGGAEALMQPEGGDSPWQQPAPPRVPVARQLLPAEQAAIALAAGAAYDGLQQAGVQVKVEPPPFALAARGGVPPLAPMAPPAMAPAVAMPLQPLQRPRADAERAAAAVNCASNLLGLSLAVPQMTPPLPVPPVVAPHSGGEAALVPVDGSTCTKPIGGLGAANAVVSELPLVQGILPFPGQGVMPMLPMQQGILGTPAPGLTGIAAVDPQIAATIAMLQQQAAAAAAAASATGTPPMMRADGVPGQQALQGPMALPVGCPTVPTVGSPFFTVPATAAAVAHAHPMAVTATPLTAHR